MKNHQHINGDSGSDEYYTPAAIIEAARNTLGGIDLDPASSEIANGCVRAKTFFKESDDALNRNWFGAVWMNHPFGRKTNKPWIKKLMAEWQSGRVAEAICITFASTSEEWFRPLLAFPQCYIHGRTNYLLPNGKVKKGATKGSVVTYLGKHPDKFASCFKQFGTVKITL